MDRKRNLPGVQTMSDVVWALPLSFHGPCLSSWVVGPSLLSPGYRCHLSFPRPCCSLSRSSVPGSSSPCLVVPRPRPPPAVPVPLLHPSIIVPVVPVPVSLLVVVRYCSWHLKKLLV